MTAYQEFLVRINELSAALQAHYARHLACRTGCSSCCHHHLSVFTLEADAIAQAVTALPNEMQQRVIEQAKQITGDESQPCPLLVDDRCAIYAARPVICRTQGLPLLLETENGELEVDFCPLNFTAKNATDDLTEDKLVLLDKINLQLAVLNVQHCRAQDIPDEQSGERIKMSEVILRTVTNEKV
jgi:Fe-S-cluster containining protein